MQTVTVRRFFPLALVLFLVAARVCVIACGRLADSFAAQAGIAMPAGLANPQIGRNVPSGPDCAKTSTGMTALGDLGTGTYKGFEGGLYPGGRSDPPPAYLETGLTHARKIKPLDRSGQPASDGKIVLLSVGMSNTSMEFSAFKRLADGDDQKNPQLTIVDGAQGGQDAERTIDPGAPYWSVVDRRLREAGVNAEQVEVVWLKQAIAGEHRDFPSDARRLEEDLRAIVRILEQRYRNLQIVYISSRIYAGYATTRLNPEPYAYESGFAVKWLIEEQIPSKNGGPWLAWGPYLWTDGTRGRSDGLVWNCEDVGPDGTHPSPKGRQKVAELLLRFFKSDKTAKRGFLK